MVLSVRFYKMCTGCEWYWKGTEVSMRACFESRVMWTICKIEGEARKVEVF